jgi:hypothetical protein
LEVLEVYKKKTPVAASEKNGPLASTEPASAAPDRSVTRSTMSLAQANLLVAMLGGFWGRKGDGHPGAPSLGRGLELLAALVHHCEILGLNPKRSRYPPKRPRKPG